MIKKIRCPNCKEKVKESFSFCPTCGEELVENQKGWGMLGKKDSINQEKTDFFEGFTGSILNKMLKSSIKMLEREMQKDLKENPQPFGNMRLMINGKEITPKKIQQIKNKPKYLPIDFSKENLEKYRKMKKTEPNSTLKRVDNKVKYELEVPEVKSIKDISIIKLENSLEVKAVGQKVAYSKRIPIDLPLKKYSLINGLLTLELEAEN